MDKDREITGALLICLSWHPQTMMSIISRMLVWLITCCAFIRICTKTKTQTKVAAWAPLRYGWLLKMQARSPFMKSSFSTFCVLLELSDGSAFFYIYFGRLQPQQHSAPGDRGPLQWAKPQHWLWQFCGLPDPLRVALWWAWWPHFYPTATATSTLHSVMTLSSIWHRHLQEPGHGGVWSD